MTHSVGPAWHRQIARLTELDLSPHLPWTTARCLSLCLEQGIPIHIIGITAQRHEPLPVSSRGVAAGTVLLLLLLCALTVVRDGEEEEIMAVTLT